MHNFRVFIESFKTSSPSPIHLKDPLQQKRPERSDMYYWAYPQYMLVIQK